MAKWPCSAKVAQPLLEITRRAIQAHRYDIALRAGVCGKHKEKTKKLAAKKHVLLVKSALRHAIAGDWDKCTQALDH